VYHYKNGQTISFYCNFVVKIIDYGKSSFDFIHNDEKFFIRNYDINYTKGLRDLYLMDEYHDELYYEKYGFEIEYELTTVSNMHNFLKTKIKGESHEGKKIVGEMNIWLDPDSNREMTYQSFE
jgi:hypothetical protein